MKKYRYFKDNNLFFNWIKRKRDSITNVRVIVRDNNIKVIYNNI